ncbi:MAG: hypothetical protein GY853_09425 [PVC group bacterium]|nr:hypothetical protein [PVC group bacterium]
MTTEKLQQFIKTNNVKYFWYDGEVTMIVPYTLLNEWNEVLGWVTKGPGVKCYMRDGYFRFLMSKICARFSINMNDIFVQRRNDGLIRNSQ